MNSEKCSRPTINIRQYFSKSIRLLQSNNYLKIIVQYSNVDNILLPSYPIEHLIFQELSRAKFNYRIKFNNQVSPSPTRDSITGELPCS